MTNHAEMTALATTMTDDGVTPVVLLQSRNEILPIFITPEQAEAIGVAVEDYPFDRPLTHDLLVSMLDEQQTAVTQVRIDGLEDGTFYAKIDLEYADGTTRVFDARPSDAISIAVRVDCEIYITDEVLDEAGRDEDTIHVKERPTTDPTTDDDNLERFDDEDMPASDDLDDPDLSDSDISDINIDDPIMDESEQEMHTDDSDTTD